ncbi:IS982 family transposase [Limosilactobacillus equigenerosi]|nr:IS982 family transposase [Limosilactobacillus equigenerosi]
MLAIMRRRLVEISGPGADIAIIDSFPMPLSMSHRRYTTKIFKDIADVGKNTTKNVKFYGFKAHVMTSATGIVLNYSITKASIHDVRVAPELIAESPCKNILADMGYIGEDYVAYAKDLGYNFWTPYRSNMNGAKEQNSYDLIRCRGKIERCFSILNSNYDIEKNRARSLTGFQTRFKVSLLMYNLGFYDLPIN